MASSRKPKRSSASPGLVSHVAKRLRGVVGPGERVVAGLSGGVDSVVLLDVLAKLAKRMGFELEALHVNHQLSPNAASWARVCRALCRARGVRCRVVKVDVVRGNSVERAARDARYRALRGTRADHIVLAHNRDDQAETVLLQLLRGAGVKGLAAMAEAREDVSPSLLRPLLDMTRSEIERYAKRRKLEWIEDESNLETRYTRNWLRHDVLPLIEARVPAYRETLARAAQNVGEAAALLDDLAHIDARTAADEGSFRVDAVRELSPARARNLLRFAIAAGGWRMPDARRLDEALRQVLQARRDASVAVSLGECELRRHRGGMYLLPARGASAPAAAITWHGEREIALPHAGGVLTMARRRGDGLSAARLADAPITIRARQGGERLQSEANRPRRTVKNLLQEARLPPWQRERLPFIYCGEVLACIPGVAVDWRFRAGKGEASIVPSWRSSPARVPR